VITTDNGHHTVHLVQDYDDFKQMVDQFKTLPKGSLVGLDTETSGLDYNTDRVAGYCISCGDPSHQDGYYLPIRHYNYPNLPEDRVVKFIQCLVNNFTLVLFNRDFDFFMMENDGITLPIQCTSRDAQILVWGVSQAPFPALKKSYEQYCGVKTSSFEELRELEILKAASHNFMDTDPQLSYIYAATDPCITVELYQTLWERFPYTNKIFELDNEAAEVLRQFSKNPAEIDYDFVKSELVRNEELYRQWIGECYTLAGEQFNHRSSRDKARILSRYVTLTDMTDKGAIKVDKDTLDKVDHPIAKALIKLSEIDKYIGTYLKPILQYDGKPLRFRYSSVKAPTARVASSSDKENSYFSMNIQSFPHIESVMYIHPDDNLGYIANDNPNDALGEAKLKTGFRRAVKAPDGWAFATFDYSGEEIRITGNLANESVWIKSINSGGDVHSDTSDAIFGCHDKVHRSHTKSVTFGLLYGMGLGTLAKRLNMSRKEAQQIYDAYMGGLPGVKAFIDRQHAYAKANYCVYDFFDRRRDLSAEFNTSDAGKFQFGLRSSVNSIIQSTAADVLKTKYIQLWHLYNTDPDFRECVRILFSVHDEINAYVRCDYLPTFWNVIPSLMCFYPEAWKIPLIVDTGIGTSWGTCLDPVLIDSKGRIMNIDNPDFKWYPGLSPIERGIDLSTGVPVNVHVLNQIPYLKDKLH